MSLGSNIRRRRLALDLSQQQLADALGYRTRSSIAKLEKDSIGLGPDKLLALANILHTTVDYLVTGTVPEGEQQRGTVVSRSSLGDIPSGRKDKRKSAAVLLAGGKNRVNKHGIPLQFVSVREKPVIIYTMETFQSHPMVDEIDVVCLDGWEDFLPAYAEKYGIAKLRDVIPAGETGVRSVKNAVEWLSSRLDPFDIMILQEATRPFVDQDTISNAILCCRQYGSAVTFERMDQLTPFLLGEDKGGLTHLPASRLINVQSPEVYPVGALRQAFYEANASRHPMDETICSVFLHHLGRELHFCEGSHDNLRIVYEEDLKLMEALI